MKIPWAKQLDIGIIIAILQIACLRSSDFSVIDLQSKARCSEIFYLDTL